MGLGGWILSVSLAEPGALPTGVDAGPRPAVSALPAGQPALVAAARKYLGRPYSFGGRDANLDCMGLVFLAWQDAGRGSWDDLSVNPTEIVAKRQLGTPVPGLDGVPNAQVSLSRFAPGDVIFFLGYAKNPAEPSIANLYGVPAWVWHMGMYAGGGNFVVGDHYAGKVVEIPLLTYLAKHDNYAGVFVVRPPA